MRLANSMALGVGGGEAPPDPPVNSVAPVIEVEFGGDPITGAVVQLAAQGEWTGTVDARTYQWFKDFGEVVGETATSINTGTYGAGTYSVVETAANAGGSAPVESNFLVISDPP